MKKKSLKESSSTSRRRELPTQNMRPLRKSLSIAPNANSRSRRLKSELSRCKRSRKPRRLKKFQSRLTADVVVVVVAVVADAGKRATKQRRRRHHRQVRLSTYPTLRLSQEILQSNESSTRKRLLPTAKCSRTRDFRSESSIRSTPLNSTWKTISAARK